MNFWGGLLGGFLDRKYALEAQANRASELAADRENRVFTTLLNSDDPEVSKMALAGLLHSTDPRQKAKGLRGWVGETLASPYMGKIDALMQTPVRRTETTTIQGPGENIGIPSPIPGMANPAPGPTEAVTPSLTQPSAAAAPAGMPPDSLVKPGGPPPAPVGWTQAPPTPITLQRQVLQPREAFVRPLDRYALEQIAKNRADIEGDVAGYMALGLGRPEALKQVMTERLRRGGGAIGPRYEGNVLFEQLTPDEQAMVPGGHSGLMLRRTVDPQTLRPTFYPITQAFQSAGTQNEAVAGALFGKRFADLEQGQKGTVLQAVQSIKGAPTVTAALTAANQWFPNLDADTKMSFVNSLLQATQPNFGTNAPPPAPTGAAAVQQQIGGTVEAPSAAGVTPPPAPGGKTPLKVPSDLATATKETGKPLPAEAQTAVARTKSLNDTITRAMTALGPLKNSTNLDDTMKFVEKYRMGTEGDLSALEAAQLGDLAGLQQAASQTVRGGSRSQRVYADTRLHTPRFPSARQILFAHGGGVIPGIGAGAVQTISSLRGDEAMWDSPAQIYNKLASLKQANDDFIRDVEQAAQQPMTRPMPSHETTPSRPTIDQVRPGEPYFDPNPPPKGTWRVKQNQ